MAASSGGYGHRVVQQESLTTRIRNVCTEYAVGNSTFMEGLANADDAGAKRYTIILDETTYPSDNVLDANLGPFQGPAMVFVDDAQFKDADWEGFLRIGDSAKKDDPGTTGKFGLGALTTLLT
ncbi:hypothetical protein WJX72_007691 [[Myrmecia] bisecta]|uniref:Sacsin/Nov domain-containing protein n=1 Tax=[Myrmecia] bisecta TaxID=41462 RepID=A0AAW1Q488_9CHLO